MAEITERGTREHAEAMLSWVRAHTRAHRAELVKANGVERELWFIVVQEDEGSDPVVCATLAGVRVALLLAPAGL